MTDTVRYDAFGNVVNRTGTTPTPFGFAGGSQYQTDGDSSLILLGYRYYDSSIGRFITQDPTHAGTNWYAYAYNNPLSNIDPLGLDPGGPGIAHTPRRHSILRTEVIHQKVNQAQVSHSLGHREALTLWAVAEVTTIARRLRWLPL